MIILSLLAATQLDALADVSRRSAELRSFSATYELSGTASPATTQIQIDFVGPGRVRVDRTAGEQRTSMWCVDGELAMNSLGGEGPFQGRVDSAGLYAELEPMEKALHNSFPKARACSPRSASVGVHWAFDDKSQQATFSIDAQLGGGFESPLGWLETLKQKHAVAREDKDLLHFETDGAFQIAISKSSGFLEKFSGKSPKGEMHIALISVDQKAVIDPARFTIPPPSAGAKDITPDLQRTISRVAEIDLRQRFYEAMAVASPTGDWDEAQQAKIRTVLGPFYARAVSKTLGQTLERWTKIRETVALQIASMRKEGKTEAEVDQLRQREGGYLKKQLDDLEQGFLKRVSVPASAQDLPRAKELLALENQAVTEAFRTQVREPMLALFESALK